MWVTKILIFPVEKGFFAPKRTNLAQNWHFWSIWARPCRLIRCPVGGSVDGCGAWAVSRKTPIYFIVTNENGQNRMLKESVELEMEISKSVSI